MKAQLIAGQYHEFEDDCPPEYMMTGQNCPLRPSIWHEWSGFSWVENTAARQADERAVHNAALLAEIAVLESKLLRPLREIALGDTTQQARIADLDAQIATIRAGLL